MSEKIDIIKVEVDIIKAKLFTFLTIASGSWVYSFKVNDAAFMKVLYISFAISCYGVFLNLLKLSDLHDDLKGLK